MQTTGTIAIKSWVNLATPLNNYSLVYVLRNTATGQYVTLGGDGKTPANWVTSDNTTGNVLTDHPGTVPVPPLDTWVCVEFVFDFATRRVRGYVDGALVVEAIENDAAPAYADIAVGAPRAQPAGFHVFVDDVVIANQRIGCP